MWATQIPNITTRDDNFVFQHISDDNGLYFEKISPIRLYNSEWHIVYHMNLSSIHNEFIHLVEAIDELERLCVRLKNDFNYDGNGYEDMMSLKFTRECGVAFEQIQLMMRNIEEFNAEWFYDRENVRDRRAPLSIVGSVMKAVFGTLSQEDAEDYLQRFQHMELLNAQRQVETETQTTMLRSTAQILSEMHDQNMEWRNDTIHQFTMMNKTLEMLQKHFDDIWINMELQFQLDNLLLTISLAITTFFHNQRRLLEAMSVGNKQSTTTPIILPPATLMDELEYIKTHLSGQGLELPLPIDKPSMVNFYNIATTRSRIIKDQLVVAMSIPLVGPESFDLIKLTSLPSRLTNGLFSFIVPAHEYVALNSYRDAYISLSETELEKCHDLRDVVTNDELICMQSSPLFSISTIRDDCGMTLLTNQEQGDICDIRISNITSEIFLRLRQPNTWLAVFPHKQIVYIRCNNAPTTEVTIEGTGIVYLKQECQLKIDGLIIQAHSVYESHVFTQIIPSTTMSWDVNKTLNLINYVKNTFVKEINSPQVISYGEIDKLKSISTNIKEIERQAEIFTRIKPERIHYTPQDNNYMTIILISLLILLLNIIILICYDYVRTNNHYTYSPREAEQNIIEVAPVAINTLV